MTSTTHKLPFVETMTNHQRSVTWRSDTARSLDHPIIFWISRGQGRFMVDCKMRGVGPNTVIYVPANTLFSYEMFGQAQGMVVYLPEILEARFPDHAAIIKVPTMQAHGGFNTLIDTLSREIETEQPAQRTAVRAHVMLISVWLERMIATQPEQVQGKSERVLSEFSHVVSIEHFEGKNLAEFAADLRVTPTHLTRLTQGAMGKPASALVQERVINAACDALVNSEDPVKDIAEQLGFASPAYFTRAFQHHTGQSPSDFRKIRRLNS